MDSNNDTNDSTNLNNNNNNNPPPQFNIFPPMPPFNQLDPNKNIGLNPSFLFNPNNLYNNPNSGSFLSKSLEKIKSGDDMDIMSELINLCDQLSLNDGSIATHPNLAKLLEEICKNLDKTYLPEIVIYSLQCMNYILDINPRLSSIIRNNNIVTKLINIMNTLEDITCLDSIVTVFEKISTSNALLLLDNNVFLCLNISYNVFNYKEYDVYIKPASPILCNLMQYKEGVTDPQILEKLIDIYFNIVNNLQMNIKNDTYYLEIMENELVQYTYLENFYDLLTRYFIERDKKINPELIKKTLINIKTICKISRLVVDKFLSINLLNILVEIINYEFSNNQTNQTSNDNPINESNANSTFLTELFGVLISIFPQIKEDSTDIEYIKILSKNNKEYYKFFCKEILKPLINNIMSKSACSNLDNLIQLILVFIKSTDKDNIIAHIDSKPMSQIISKLLDTKYYVYLNDLSTLIDILLTKTSNYYMNNFLREGIIDTIQKYILDINLENIDIINNEFDDEKEKENFPEQKDSVKELLNKLNKGEGNKLELLDKLLLLDEQALKEKKEELISEQKILTQKKVRKLYEKYFTPEKIEEYNNNINSDDKSFTNLKETLSNLNKDLIDACKNITDENDYKEKIIPLIQSIIDIITNPINEITFFELESSKILLGLCHFLEPQILSLYDKLDIQNDNVLKKEINLKDILPNPLIYNKHIFDKMNYKKIRLFNNINELFHDDC